MTRSSVICEVSPDCFAVITEALINTNGIQVLNWKSDSLDTDELVNAYKMAVGPLDWLRAGKRTKSRKVCPELRLLHMFPSHIVHFLSNIFVDMLFFF